MLDEKASLFNNEILENIVYDVKDGIVTFPLVITSASSRFASNGVYRRFLLLNSRLLTIKECYN